MTGWTADISNICEYYWYEWVMFCDQPITHLDLLVILGQNLRLAIDVESAMNYKIMKVNGEYVCRTTV